MDRDIYYELSALLGLFETHQALTLAIHVCIEIQLGNIICRSSLKPNTLPDTTARRVKDVTRVQSLFPNRNNIIAIICGIMDENKPAVRVRIYQLPLKFYSQLILLIKFQVLCYIQRESEVTTTVEASLLAIDKDRGFIVHCSEVKQNFLSLPRRGHLERRREP